MAVCFIDLFKAVGPFYQVYYELVRLSISMFTKGSAYFGSLYPGICQFLMAVATCPFTGLGVQRRCRSLTA